MRFFVSGTIDHQVIDAFDHARGRVETQLNNIVSGKNFGSALELIGVIPTISDRLPFWERRLFQRSKRTADYRLRISAKLFRSSNSQGRVRLLVDNVLTAIVDLHRKANAAGLDFDGERLAEDVKKHFRMPNQPNSTPHTDARKAPVSRARTGGLGR